ncbi:MAG: ABC transporter permease [Acidimicrobiales bacterium]
MVAPETPQTMTAARLAVVQIRYLNKAFWRNPSRAFFTFAFPLMFLVIFTSMLGNYTVHLGATTVRTSTYYVSAMAAFAVISACYTDIAITVSFQRDTGILKRIDGSPLPKLSFMLSRVVHAIGVAVLLVVITAAFGHAFYHAQVPTSLGLLRFIVMLLVGSAAFCALGLAVTAIVPNADASSAIVNATILPLLFLSGIFIPLGNQTQAWIVWVARVFPVRHFASGMMAGFIGTPFDWVDVLVVLAWGAAGLLVAVRFFSWRPRT